MIYIGICDDEVKHQQKIHDVISRILFAYDEMQFFYYTSGSEVLKAIEQNQFSCELLLLDINMPGQNGLDIAAYIRRHQIDVDIIFITVSSEHVFDGYTYQAFSYLLKPLDINRVEEELHRYMTLRDSGSRCLHVSAGGKQIQIFLDRVQYFMTDNRKITAHYRGEEEDISFYAKMGDVEQMLSEDDFISCHQSYLVNPRYVQSCSRTEIDLGEEQIPISRRYVNQVRAYFNTNSK